LSAVSITLNKTVIYNGSEGPSFALKSRSQLFPMADWRSTLQEILDHQKAVKEENTHDMYGCSFVFEDLGDPFADY